MPSAFDDPRHRESEVFAFRAERADADAARELWAQAAALEAEAARAAPHEDDRIRAVLVRSAAWLFVKAEMLDAAEQFALEMLNPSAQLSIDGRESLHPVLARVWARRSDAKLSASSGLLPLWVSLDGRDASGGVVAARAVTARRSLVLAMVGRAAEALQQGRFARRLRTSAAELFTVHEAPALPGSYTFRLLIGDQPDQTRGAAHEAVAHMLDYVELAAREPSKLQERLPTADHHRFFLSAARDLAPDDHSLSRVELLSAGHGPMRRIQLSPSHRVRLAQLLNEDRTTQEVEREGELVVVSLARRRRHVEIRSVAETTRFELADHLPDEGLGLLLRRWVRIFGRRDGQRLVAERIEEAVPRGPRT